MRIVLDPYLPSPVNGVVLFFDHVAKVMPDAGHERELACLWNALVDAVDESEEAVVSLVCLAHGWWLAHA